MAKILSIKRPLDLRTRKKINAEWSANMIIERDPYLDNEDYVEIDEELYLSKVIKTSKSNIILDDVELYHICTELSDLTIDRFFITDTVANHLTYILAGTGWSVGTCNITSTVYLKFDRMVSVMEALNDLAIQAKGELYFYSDTRTVDLLTQIGTATKLRLTYGKNCNYIERIKDSRLLCTRIIPFGPDNYTINTTYMEDAEDETLFTASGSATLEGSDTKVQGSQGIKGTFTALGEYIMRDRGAGALLDLSDHDKLSYWIYSAVANANGYTFYMGEENTNWFYYMDYWPTSAYNYDRTLYNGAYNYRGQCFYSHLGGNCSQIQLYLKKFGAPTGNATLYLYEITGEYGIEGIPTGSALATSNTLDVSTLTTSMVLKTFTFSSPYYMEDGHYYAWVLNYSGGNSSNYVIIGADSNYGHAGNAFYGNAMPMTPVVSYDLIFYVNTPFAYNSGPLKASSWKYVEIDISEMPNISKDAIRYYAFLNATSGASEMIFDDIRAYYGNIYIDSPNIGLYEKRKEFVFNHSAKVETSTATEKVYPSDDAVVHQQYPTTNFGSSTELEMYYYTTSGVTHISYLKFPLTAIPSGAVITSAKLKMYCYYTLNNGPLVHLHRLAQDFNEHTITWNNKPNIVAGDITTFQPDDGQWNDVDILALVQGWFDGTYDNYGIMLQSETDQHDLRCRYYSKEYSDINYRPYLEITYTLSSNPDTIIIADAEDYLYSHDEPSLKYSVRFIDLKRVNSDIWKDEELHIGDTIRVYDEDLDINTDCRIFDIEKDDNNPENTQIDLVNKAYDAISVEVKRAKQLSSIMPYLNDIKVADASAIQKGYLGSEVNK